MSSPSWARYSLTLITSWRYVPLPKRNYSKTTSSLYRRNRSRGCRGIYGSKSNFASLTGCVYDKCLPLLFNRSPSHWQYRTSVVPSSLMRHIITTTGYWTSGPAVSQKSVAECLDYLSANHLFSVTSKSRPSSSPCNFDNDDKDEIPKAGNNKIKLKSCLPYETKWPLFCYPYPSFCFSAIINSFLVFPCSRLNFAGIWALSTCWKKTETASVPRKNW